MNSLTTLNYVRVLLVMGKITLKIQYAFSHVRSYVFLRPNGLIKKESVDASKCLINISSFFSLTFIWLEKRGFKYEFLSFILNIASFRKELSHWTKRDVPSLKLVSQLDTDHWAKLKGKVSTLVQDRNVNSHYWLSNTFLMFVLRILLCIMILFSSWWLPYSLQLSIWKCIDIVMRKQISITQLYCRIRQSSTAEFNNLGIWKIAYRPALYCAICSVNKWINIL